MVKQYEKLLRIFSFITSAWIVICFTGCSSYTHQGENVTVEDDFNLQTMVTTELSSMENGVVTSILNQDQSDASESTEMLEDGRIRHTFSIEDYIIAEDIPQTISIVVDSKWIRKGTCFEEEVIHDDETGEKVTKKRMEVCKRNNFTENDFFAEWRDDSEAEYLSDEPLYGTTDEGIRYIGYYKDKMLEKDVIWRIYYFLLTPDEDTSYTISINQNLTKDESSFLESVVIPIINTIIIESD